MAKDMLEVVQGSGTYVKSKVDLKEFKKAIKVLKDNFMITFDDYHISVAPKKIDKYSSYNVPITNKEIEILKKCLED